MSKQKSFRNFFIYILFFLTGYNLFAAESPKWFTDKNSVYPSNKYISAMGEGKSKELSKENAITEISRYLKSEVQVVVQTQSKSELTNDKYKSSKTIEESVTINSSIVLGGLEYTQPYYVKKERKWYCVAYVEREKIWELYRPTIQSARNKFISFYDMAENSEEPFNKMLIYMKTKEYADDFKSDYSFARILSKPLTDTAYSDDFEKASSLSAKIVSERNKCTFSINVENDEKNIIYQCIKNEFSGTGYTVRNSGDAALYSVQVNVYLEDTILNSIHVIQPSVELSVEGKTTSIFSYAKQLPNVSGINEDIVKQKAVRALSDEIHNSLMNEFNEKMNKGMLEKISL